MKKYKVVIIRRDYETIVEAEDEGEAEQAAMDELTEREFDGDFECPDFVIEEVNSEDSLQEERV